MMAGGIDDTIAINFKNLEKKERSVTKTIRTEEQNISLGTFFPDAGLAIALRGIRT